MFRRFIASVVLLIISIASWGQNGYGPFASAGTSEIHFAPALLYTRASQSQIFSCEFGGIADLQLHRHIYFQTGFSFSQKGGVRSFSYHDNDSFNESVQQTLVVGYLNVPALVVFKTSMQGKMRFYAGIGGTASYMIVGKNNLNVQGVSAGVPYNAISNTAITPNNPLSAFDIGISLKAGIELPTGLFFHLYYLAGVNDLGQGTETDKNRMYGVCGGYFFGKGRNVNTEVDLIDNSDE
jgi:Outer membrane protein beta-barrel domain